MRTHASTETFASTVGLAPRLAIAILVALVSIAGLTSRHAGHAHADASIRSSYPAVPIEELADVILIFRPRDDHLVSVVEEIVLGDILRIEKGRAPRLIVNPAGTIGPVWKAGVPIKLFLKAFTDRSAHYPIWAFPDPGPKPPAIAVAATDGLANIHAAIAGTTIVVDSVLTVPDPGSAVHVDVYVGVTEPDGASLWLATDLPGIGLVASAAPIALLVDVVPTQRVTLRTFHPLSAAGWYMYHGIVVPTGADPRDPRRWINTSFFPLLATSWVTQ